MDDPRASMLRQSKSIFIELLTEPTNVISDVVLDLCELGFRLVGDLNDIKRRVDVTLSHHEVLVRPQLPDDGARDRRAVILVEVELPRGLGFLGRRVRRALLGRLGGWRLGAFGARGRSAWGRDRHLALQTQVQGVG